MTRRSVVFTGPRQVDVRSDRVPEPGRREVLVETLASAISAGTELLVYRGEVPETFERDERLETLSGSFRYPFTYGYSAVGRVSAIGNDVDPGWQDKLVFAFHPHASHFTASTDVLHEVPGGVSPEEACCLPSVETAVNLLLDARPAIGEKVLVIGQGMVGLSLTALLSKFPLGLLRAVEPDATRRQKSLRLGAGEVVVPGDLHEGAVDVCFELSGRPEALNVAIAATGFEGRIIVGSWYGTKRAPVELGTHFHRRRLRLVSSQVSHIASELRARWTKARRLDVAWQALAGMNVGELITHRFPVERAPEAYRFLDDASEGALQVLLTYT